MVCGSACICLQKESVVKKAANMVLGIGDAENVTAGLMRMEEGNWRVLGIPDICR